MKKQNLTGCGRTFRLLVIPGSLLLLMPFFLRAQSDNGSEPPPENAPAIHGYFEIGVRGLAGDHNSAQFNEYRDIHPGLFMQSSGFTMENLGGTKTSIVCAGRNLIRLDGAYRCELANPGKFSFEFSYYETPHDFTNSAKTLFIETAPGVFMVPYTTRQLLQTTPSAITTVLTGASPIDMSIERKRMEGAFTWTPSSWWLFQLFYSHESEQGFRPLGTTTNDETNQLEMPEPIKYSINEVKATAQYAKGHGAFEASFDDSIFANGIKTMSWDNPFNTTNAVNNGAAGRMVLYPSNNALSFDFAGAYNLGKSIRLIASVSPEWENQNDAFVPETVNTAITGIPSLLANSLNGQKQTLAMNYTLTAHPLNPLEFTLRYRSFDYNNDTPPLLFTNFAYTDYKLDNLQRESQPYGYSSQDLQGEAVWKFLKHQSFKAGYQWEELDRQHRDVAKSDENTGYIGLSLNPTKWITLTSTGKHSDREPSNYQLNLDTYPNGGNRQFALDYRFDEAMRVRNQADVLLQIDAGDRLSFYGSYDTIQDQYPESLYGMLNWRNGSEGAGFTYALNSHMSLFGDYTLEKYWSDMRSRQRSSTNDTSNNDWQTDTRDRVNTGGGGISFNARDGKLTLDTYYDVSVAVGNQANRALGNPALAGFLVTAIQNYPETSNRSGAFNADVRYRLARNVTPRLQYRYETFGNIDFQTSPVMPYMGTFDTRSLTSIYLGATLPAYAVNTVTASLDYRF